MATELFCLAGKEALFNRQTKKWITVATLYYTKGISTLTKDEKNHFFIVNSLNYCPH